MKIISSRQNPIIKEICLLHDVTGRQEKQQYIGQGLRVVKTLVNSNQKLVRLFATKTHLSFAKKLVGEEVITLVPESVMLKISTTKTSPGIVGIFAIKKQPSFNLIGPGLVLVTIADPGNMGTLIRTSAAMAIPNIVCIGTVDPYNPKVVQATAGTIGMVNLFQMNWDELQEHKKNIPLYALIVSGGKPPQDLNIANSLLVVGSEAHGIPEDYINQCEDQVTLPMPGGTESLNASIAASIALYIAWSQS